MDVERWNKLSGDIDGSLTQEEMDAGWHWCFDFDEMLVGPEMPLEWDVCTCFSVIEKAKYAAPSRSPDR